MHALMGKLRRRLQAVLQQLERPLLCSSIRPLDELSGALDDGAVLLDRFAPRGLDYVVDNGARSGKGSSVVDMTARTSLASEALCRAEALSTTSLDGDDCRGPCQRAVSLA